jgi:hypothetical protein
MVPIKYRVVGEEDYAFDVEIGETGEYRVSGGTYTSQPPHTGRLSGEQEAELLAAVGALGAPGAHAMPREAAAFEAHLAIGAQGAAKTYRFWEGALQKDAKLARLVRLLETL